MAVSELEKLVDFDLRGSWQARALAEAKGQTEMVLISVIEHRYGELVLMALLELVGRLCGPGDPPLPCLASIGKIAKTGAVAGTVIDKAHRVIKDAVIYPSEIALRDDFRRLADRLKLSDIDRVELFKCVQRWCPADSRLDPTFDPQDPDAKRLLH